MGPYTRNTNIACQVLYIASHPFLICLLVLMFVSMRWPHLPSFILPNCTNNLQYNDEKYVATNNQVFSQENSYIVHHMHTACPCMS